MSLTIIIVLVVLLIIFVSENNKKDKENLILKQKLNEYIKFVNENFKNDADAAVSRQTSPIDINKSTENAEQSAEAYAASTISNPAEQPTAVCNAPDEIQSAEALQQPIVADVQPTIAASAQTTISSSQPIAESARPIAASAQPATASTQPTIANVQPAMVSAPVQNAAAYSQPAPRTQEKSSVSTISIVLILGSLFIIIACLIFATASWSFIGNGMRAASLLAISAVFFGVSSFSERKLRLEKTGIAFYIMGSICLPITLLAAGWLKLFGEWFSLGGGGRFVLLSLIFAVSYIAFLKGNIDYKKIGFSVACAIALCGLVSSAFMIFTPPVEIFFIASAVYSLALSLLAPLIKLNEGCSAFVRILKKQLDLFTVLNTVFIALLSLFLLGNTPISAISSLLLGAAFLGNSFNKNSGFAGAFPFTLLMTLAVYKVTLPSNADSVVIMLAIIAVMVSALSLMKLIGDKLRTCLAYISFAFSAFTLVLNLRFIVTSDMTMISLLFSAIMSANILIFAIRRKSRAMYGCFAAALVLTAFTASRLIPCEPQICIAVFSLLMLIFTVGYNLIGIIPLRSRFSDILFFTSQAAAVIMTIIQIDSRSILAELAVPVIAFAMCLYLAIFSEKGMRKFFLYVLPISLLGVMPPVQSLLISGIQADFGFNATFTVLLLWYIAIVIGGAVNTLVFKSKTMSGVFMIYAVCGGILFTLGYVGSDVIFSSVFAFLLTAYFSVRLFFDKSCNKKAMLCLSVLLFPFSSLLLTFGLICTTPEVFLQSLVQGLLINAAIAAAYYAVYELVKKLRPDNALLKTAYSTISVLMIVISSLLLVICLPSAYSLQNNADVAMTVSGFAVLLPTKFRTFISGLFNLSGGAYWLPVTLTAALAMFMRYRSRSNACVLHVSALLYIYLVAVIRSFIPYDAQNADLVLLFTVIGASVIYTALSRIIHGNKPYRDPTFFIDIFGNVTIIGALIVLGCEDKYISWTGTLLAAAYALVRFGRPKNGNAPLIATSCAILVLSWWTQPFLEIPRLITAEYYILPVFLYLGLLMLLFKKSRHEISTAIFVISVISAVILTLDAIIQQSIFAALIIAILALSVLIISFAIRLKRWFLLSVVTILGFGLYMSAEFWSALSWWVYLLLAGILLITIGSVNELRKQKRRENSDGEIGRFMHEWKR